jgi:hypothetical protein
MELIWIVLGSVGYWGNMASSCSSPLDAYLNFTLVTVYLARFLNIFFAHRFRKGELIEIDDEE